jgi:hypothetical protein
MDITMDITTMARMSVLGWAGLGARTHTESAGRDVRHPGHLGRVPPPEHIIVMVRTTIWIGWDLPTVLEPLRAMMIGV